MRSFFTVVFSIFYHTGFNYLFVSKVRLNIIFGEVMRRAARFALECVFLNLGTLSVTQFFFRKSGKIHNAFIFNSISTLPDKKISGKA